MKQTDKKNIDAIPLLYSEIQKVCLIMLLSAILAWPFGIANLGIIAGLMAYIVYLITVALRYYKALQLLNFSDLPYNGRLLASISDNILGIHKKQRVLNKRLKKQVKSQSSMLDAWPDAMIVVDKQYVIQQYNRQAMFWLGLTRSDNGQYVNNIIRDANLLKLLKEQVSQKGKKQKKHQERVIIHSPNNPNQLLDVRLVDFIGELYLLTFNDVTQRQNVSRMRKDFIANISHELKTPLTSIKGFSELLADTATDEQTQYIRYLTNETARMESIVEDLLNLSTLESAPSPSMKKVVNISEILQKEVALIVDLHPKVDIDMSVDETLMIYGESSEWQSLINNILNNAIQHNSQQVKIECDWSLTTSSIPLVDNEQDDAIDFETQPRAILTIRDNGIGVDKAELPLLTERFYRSDDSRENQDKRKGTGLGLSIVKHVVERHQGSLIVESQINQGLMVQCVLPYHGVVTDKSLS